MVPLSICLLGEFRVLHAGTPVALPPSRKTRALLAYLVVTGRRHRRERLCRLLWDVPDDPRGALRWSLSRLRRLVDEPDRQRIIADRDFVALDASGVLVDLAQVRRELAAGPEALSTERLLDLATAFSGEFLEGMALPDQHDFEAWLLAERDGARRTRASLLSALLPRLMATPDKAIPHARDLVEADPLSVGAHVALLECLIRAGRRAEAELQKSRSEQILADAGTRELTALDQVLLLRPESIPPAVPIDHSGSDLHQDIRFCSTPDGVRIAYATVGDGPPLIKTANWLNHLEFDWESPIWRHVFRGLARDRRLIRYDARGNGLSDWDVEEISFEAYVRDLESVVDAAGVERFPLLGISQGCAISVEYAVRHPERVTRLVLHGGYATGWRLNPDPEEIARREALQTLILLGWGQDNPAFRQVFTSGFIPDGSPEQFHWMNELQRISISPENAVRLQNAVGIIDMRDRLSLVRVPTLVLHSRWDARVPYARGQELAKGIPNARLVTLLSRNHLILEHEPESSRFLEVIREFLAEDTGDPR
ncbi:MAG TPA: alpha/beta fold hydrolase [Candidatus Polarisedimenticolia bacterium]|nr:alpha/beta fold hydrolase [Candidatus Polarisedimenticolia bacterium]